MSLAKSICCLSVLLFLGCGPKEKSAPVQPDPTAAQPIKSLREAWQLFATAVIKNDVATLKALSAPKIHCAACVTNTPQEEAAWEVYQEKNPNGWFDKLYTELAYIEADVFIKNDAAMVFDERMKSRLLDESKLGFLEEEKVKEVLVTIIDPSNKSEGMQAAFAFEPTKTGYRFCGYSTIP